MRLRALYGLLIWSAAALCLMARAGAASSDTLLDSTDPMQVQRGFTPGGPGWAVHRHGYGGLASGSWSFALAGEPSWTDYRADFRLTLVKPADRRDGLELTAYAVYRALADLGGYEAAAVVRYQSPERHYRVAVSSLWKEVILWRPTGGVVQAASYPFETGKSYSLGVDCRGPQIVVRVDGKEVIHWWDTADAVVQGRVGIGRKEGESYFASARVKRLPPQTARPPAHRPQLREQTWHGLRWFFDGQEPLFVLTDANVLDHMKLMPGYRSAMYTFNYVTDWGQFYPKKVTAFRLVESGPRLVIETTAVDPDKKNGITCAARLEVTYDADRGMYAYDHTCTTRLASAADAEKVASDWDHGDAVFLGSVGSAQTRDPHAARPLYQWTVFQAPDGRFYKVPLNHNGHYLGKVSSNGGPLKPDGGFLAAVGDPVLSPVIRVPGLAHEIRDITAGLCWWGYDVHTLFTPKKVAGRIAPGAYVSRVQYTGMRASEARRLLDQAGFYQPEDVRVRIPVYTAGIGHTEPFDKDVLLASPHPEHRLWAGFLDRAVGRGDHSSLRLDGPTEAWTLTGPSYFMSPYGKKTLVTAWVKTQDVQGEGPAIGFRRWDNNEGVFHCTGLTGTHDWTQVRFVTSFPADSYGMTLYFRNSGSGIVWFDDFRIEKLDEKASLAAPPARSYPIGPPNPDVVLRWDGRGDAGSVLDGSGYGHHGKFHGQVRWAEEGGRRALALDGKTGYIWPLSSPYLTLGPPCTLLWEMKPEAEGTLLAWGFQFTYALVGGPDRFAVEYRPHGGSPVKSKPFLEANAWQRLALVVQEGKILLYRNDEFVEELGVKTAPGNWSLHAHTTWHRHLSLFGFGPGDMGVLQEPSLYHWKGQVRSLTLVRRTLTGDQIRTRK